MLGYSDDNWVLAPSLDALQEMMNIIENYCQTQNLKFSTDSDPKKCKTKCIAFLKKERPLPSIILCGNRLPWVKNGIHLGNNFNSKYDGLSSDIILKRACYIQKNCEILQEFFYAHPRTKFQINNIYNCHFTGSPLWDLFGPDAVKLEKTWNVSVRQMFSLPRETHKYLIEPISESWHIKKILLLRFISFVKQIKTSKKRAPKVLLRVIESDTRSVTGNNIRNILRLTKKMCINDVVKQDIDNIEYMTIPDDEKWRVSLIKNVIEALNLPVDTLGPSINELRDILNFVCTS